MPNNVTKTELARVCSVSPATVSNWIRNGQVFGGALIGEGTRQKVKLKTALQQLDQLDIGQSQGCGSARAAAVAAALGRIKKGHPAGNRLKLAEEIKSSKLRILKAKADLAEINVGIQTGALVPAPVVQEVLGDYFVALRQNVLRVITSLPVVLPHLDRTQHLAIDRIIRATMNTVVDEVCGEV